MFSSSVSKGGYKALILDFVGVLTEGVRESLQSWCVVQGLHHKAWGSTLNLHPEGRRLYLELEAGRLTQQEWNRLTAPLLGVDEHENLMGRAWGEVRPAHDMIELARSARNADLKTALLSNSFGLAPYNPYRTLGVSDLCEVTVLSELEGVAKPDPEIYRRTLDRLGVPGEKCVFVDDNPANLVPAQELGITTVLADGRKDLVEHVAKLLNIHSRSRDDLGAQ